MHVDPEVFLENVAPGLGVLYIAIALMNGLAALYVWQRSNRTGAAIGLALFAGLMAAVSAFVSPVRNQT